MRTRNKLYKTLCHVAALLSAGMCSSTAFAQVSLYDAEKRGSLYFSVGNNTPNHRPSTIEVVSGTPGNVSNYKWEKVDGDNSTTKSPGLNYNIRIGYFFDYFQNWAIELCYDPVKYHIATGQMVKMTGMLDNRDIDTTFAFTPDNGYLYNIAGANFLSVNLLRRFQIYQIKSHNVRIDALAKVGIGPCMPYTYNSIMGKTAERPQFQMGGWNAGAEGAIRLTLMRHVFAEASYKYSYASYKDLVVFNGVAQQKLVTAQMVLSVGYWFSTTKHNPLFVKPDNKKPPFSIKPINPPDPEEDQKKIMKGQPMLPAPKKAVAPAPAPAPAPVPDSVPAPDSTPVPTPDAPPAPDGTPTPEPGK